MSVDNDQVLTRAADLLTRKPTASMDDIARAAGISRATLHRQFAGRDALIRALEELGIRQLTAAVDAADIEHGEPEEAVRRIVAEVEPVAGFLGFLLTENQLFAPGELHEGWQRIDDRIGALFRRGQEQGVFRIDLSPAWLTEALYALVSASAWSVHDGRVAARDAYRMTTGLLLGGALRTRPAHATAAAPPAAGQEQPVPRSGER